MKTIAMVVMVVASLAMADDAKRQPRLLAAERIFALVPKELYGVNNAAVGEPFNEKKWNDWLAKNIVGDKLHLPGNPVVSFVKKDNAGRLFILVGETVQANGQALPQDGQSLKHNVFTTCFFKDELAAILGKLKGDEYVTVTGVIVSIERKVRILENPNGGGREIVDHQITITDCTIAITAKAKKARP